MQEVFPGAPSQHLPAKTEQREFHIVHFTGNLGYFIDGSYGLDLGVEDGVLIKTSFDRKRGRKDGKTIHSSP